MLGLPVLVAALAIGGGCEPHFQAWWGRFSSEGNIVLCSRDADWMLERGLPDADFSPAAPDLSSEPGVQNLLTELLGISERGRVVSPYRGPSSLPDPWLRLRAGGLIRGVGLPGNRWPVKWEIGQGLEGNRSHLIPTAVVHAWTLDYRNAKGYAQSGERSMRYFACSAVRHGEPTFRENGVGPARTAEEWLARAKGSAGFYFFDNLDARHPHGKPAGRPTPAITIRGSGSGREDLVTRGFVYFNAEEVRFRGMRGRGVPTEVNMPGEPFADTGIDLDGDGVICATRGAGACCPEAPSTPGERTRCNEFGSVGNGVWDIELDECDRGGSEVCASDGDAEGEAFREHPRFREFEEAVRDLPGVLPHGGTDPRVRPFAHEPFLNFDYPAPRSRDLSVRVDPAARGRRTRTGSWPNSASLDLTTRARDARGAVVELRVNVQGVVYNTGDIVMGRGFTVFGAVYAHRELRGRRSARVFADRQLPRATQPLGGSDSGNLLLW